MLLSSFEPLIVPFFTIYLFFKILYASLIPTSSSHSLLPSTSHHLQRIDKHNLKYWCKPPRSQGDVVISAALNCLDASTFIKTICFLFFYFFSILKTTFFFSLLHSHHHNILLSTICQHKLFLLQPRVYPLLDSLLLHPHHDRIPSLSRHQFVFSTWLRQ